MNYYLKFKFLKLKRTTYEKEKNPYKMIFDLALMKAILCLYFKTQDVRQ